MKFVTATLVAPSTAQTHYGASTTHTNSLAGVSGFGATAPEIVETARALKNNPDTIFDFVHDGVQTEFAFGERKGPLGALIDRSGTPFDQNVLFVNLVRQAGYSAQYQIGQATMTQAAFTGWTGVSDLGAACRMLSSGGIPAVFTPAAPSNCQTSGAFTSVTILHVWSQVSIGGTWYAYDPSFKTYAGPTPVNLISASGLTAGAAATAAATGMNSGTSGGAAYIHNVGAGTLDTYLTTVGTNLLGSLRSNSPAVTNASTWDIDQVTGVTKIQQAWAPAGGYRNTTPPGYTVASATTVTGDMPDQYRTKFQVQMSVAPDLQHYTSALNWTFFVDDVDGRRLAIGSNFNNTGSSSGGNINPANSYAFVPINYTQGTVNLQVDDVVIQSWSCTINYTSCYGAQAPGQVTLTATHPYAAGTYADETVVKQLTATAAPVAIVSGWGMISPGRLAKWSDEVATDTPLPDQGVSPWICNSQGEYCFDTYQVSSGDFTRQKLAVSWLAQTTRMMTLQAAIGGAVVDHQHSIGVVDWRHIVQGYEYPPPNEGHPNYLGVTDEFTDLNIDTVAAVTSETDSATKVAALSRSIALASATLEGSVLEQMEDLPDTASTASRFAWGNNPGADNSSSDPEDPCFTGNNPRSFFDYTGTTSSTRSGIYLFEGSASGCNAVPVNYIPNAASYFTSVAESAISSYLAAGFKVTGSAETFLGPGARFSDCVGNPSVAVNCQPSQQRGEALVGTLYDGSGNVLQVAHVLTSQSGISKGGGGKQPESFTSYDPSKAADVLKDRFIDRSVVLGVDLKSGTAGYTTPSLISIGAGSAPYKLDASLSFKAAPTGCTTYGPCTGPLQGGWNHNWDVRLTNSGSGLEAMGATSPFAAAGTIAAFLAMQDIFSQASLANLNQDVYAALVGDWWRQQMNDNIVTVNREFSGQQYVRLVDNTWLAPVGSPGVLTLTGSRVKERDGCHQYSQTYSIETSRRWNISAESFSLRNAGGDVMAFAPWYWNYGFEGDNACQNAQGFEPTTWTWPQGVSLTFTYGTGSGHSADYQSGVTGVTTSLGRTMTFTSAVPSLAGLGTITTNGVTVGQMASGAGPGIADAVAAPTGGNTGNFWTFAYTAVQARSATQRPVPYPQLYQVYNPISTTAAALQYGYDTRGLVKTAYDANGLQVPAESGLPPYSWYLATGVRGERDDPDGGAYTVWYDTDSDGVRNIDEIRREVDSQWDGRHRVTQRTFPEGDEEQFAYDLNDNVLSLTQVAKPGSGLANTVVSATYDPTWNHLASITDALNNTTNFSYYASGAGASLMSQALRPAVTYNGAQVRPSYTFTYNAIGLPTQSVDAAGITTSHAYDSYGNLTSTTEGAAALGATQWDHFTWGAPSTWAAAALNLTTNFTPDAWGNITATSDPLSRVSNTTYDLDRRKLLAIDPNPGTGVRTATNTIYDANGRATEVDKGTTNASGGSFTALETTLTAFDPNGNKTQVSVLNGPSGNAALTVTQTSYDPLNRPICTAVRENAAVFGSLPAACSQSTAGSFGPDQITQLAYDLAGQKLTETRGVGTSIQGLYGTWTYGLDGEVATTKDANANLTTNLYDGFNRLSAVEYPIATLGAGQSDPNDKESYTYDANGNRLTLTKRDGTTVITYGYDALNRRTTKTYASPWTALDVAYGYDLAGRPTSALFSTVSGTPGVTWSYDAAGRRVSEATNGRTLFFGYDAASNPRSTTFPDGISIAYAYDAANRFSSAGVANAATVTAGYDSLSRVTSLTRTGGANSAVGYDNADRMTSLAHSFAGGSGNQTWTYAFTPGDQITSALSANSAWDWQASAASAVATTPDGLNRNATVSGVSWSYDKNGNLTYDGARTFAYDPENRLVSESGPVTLALAYDPTGRMQQSVINGIITNFLYDDDALVAEFSGAGGVLRRYVHGPDVDNPVVWFEGAGVSASNANLLIADRQGSIAATANTAGALTGNYTYNAYGVPNAWGTVGSVSRFRYTGQLVIPEAKLYYYKARVYDPSAGIFLQTDPVGDKSDLNLYAYAGADPENKGDSTGECTGSLIPGDCSDSTSTVMSYGTVATGTAQNGPGALKVTEQSSGAQGSTSAAGPAGGVAVTQGQSPGTTSPFPDATTVAQLPPELLPPIEELPESLFPPEQAAPLPPPNPGIPFPKDPTVPPGPGWVWRGPPDKGSWYKPETGESLHPDFQHKEPVGPHYDYSPGRGMGGGRSGWRWFPDGRMEPKFITTPIPGRLTA